MRVALTGLILFTFCWFMQSLAQVAGQPGLFAMLSFGTSAGFLLMPIGLLAWVWEGKPTDDRHQVMQEMASHLAKDDTLTQALSKLYKAGYRKR